mgnify:CR=1 FL=1
MSATLTPNVRHITRLFRTATPEQIADGLSWYADAHDFATKLAERYNVPVHVAAGVIAAVSPLNSWGANKKLARRILAAGGLTSGYMRDGLNKATRILAGGSPLDVLSGDKVRAFYQSIVAAGKSDAVCIDRHAWSLAVNHRYVDGTIPNLKGKRYALAVAAYQRAAVILSAEYGIPISPAQVQSVTWVLWRAKFWNVGAFDGLAE